MKSAQTARRRSANHAFMNGPEAYDCFALRAELFNTFGDLLQIGVAGAARVGQIRGTLCDKIKRKHINRSRIPQSDFFSSCASNCRQCFCF